MADVTNGGHRVACDTDLEADLARYPRKPFLREQSIWAIYVYRLGRRILKRRPSMLRSVQLKLYWLPFRVVETVTGISLPLEAQIGPGLRIYNLGIFSCIRMLQLGAIAPSAKGYRSEILE